MKIKVTESHIKAANEEAGRGVIANLSCAIAIALNEALSDKVIVCETMTYRGKEELRHSKLLKEYIRKALEQGIQTPCELLYEPGLLSMASERDAEDEKELALYRDYAANQYGERGLMTRLNMCRVDVREWVQRMEERYPEVEVVE